MAKHPTAQAVHETEHRPHYFSLVFGLIDAHISGIDYFDTPGGQELRRLLRERRGLGHTTKQRTEQKRSDVTKAA
jgi:hypothetical protein